MSPWADVSTCSLLCLFASSGSNFVCGIIYFFLIELLKPGLFVLFLKCGLKPPFGSLQCRLWVFWCEKALGLGWAGVRLPSKGRLRETVAAPVVPCGCCVVGLAPAHTAAVWLSVWAAGITGRPFTPAQTAVCSPRPSTLVQLCELSAPSFLFLSFTSSAYPPTVACMSDWYLPHFIPCIPNLSVFLPTFLL